MIHGTGRELGFDEAAIWDIKVAATEALANAIEHGTASDGLIHLRLTPAKDELSLDISGGGKSERTAPAPPNSQRGRGITMMSALMDEVVLRRNGEDMLIRLVKRRTPTSGNGMD